MGSQTSKNMSPPKDLSDLPMMSKFTHDELRGWYKEFSKTRPHNYITSEEFVETYLGYFPNGNAALFAENVFKLFDSNKDGKIDFCEIAVALGTFSRGSREEKLKWMFSLYDINGDGFIKRDEMKTILTSMIRLKANYPEEVKNASAIAEQQMHVLYDELDVNKDGMLCLQEFLQVTKTSSILLDVFEQGINKAPK